MTLAVEVIDAHVHLWNSPPYEWEDAVLQRPYDVGALELHLEESAFKSAIAVQALNDMAETRWLLSIAAANAGIAGVVGWADLADSGLPQMLDELQSSVGGERLVGIRHLPFVSPANWLSRDEVLSGLRMLATRGLTFDLVVPTEGFASAVHVATQLPELRIVVDHLANGPLLSGEEEAWRIGVTALAKLPNVACKLSELTVLSRLKAWGTQDLTHQLSFALDAFGPERLIFGSDWPICLAYGSVADVLAASDALVASAADQTRFYSINARSWYGIA